MDDLETIGIALMTAGFMALIGFGILAVGRLIHYQIQQMKFRRSSALSESKTEDCSYHYAGFWNRFVALLTDVVVLSPVIMVFQLGLPFSGNPTSDYLIAKYASIIPAWLYFAFMESSSSQGTIGKRLMGLRVVDADGNRITFKRASGRFFGRFLSAIPMGIGFLMVAFTQRKQALHDMLATCLVIKKDNPVTVPLDKETCVIENDDARKEPETESRPANPKKTAEDQVDTEPPSEPENADKICSSCNGVNSSNAKFCGSCGEPFYKCCPECAEEGVRYAEEYCPQCGTNINDFLGVEEALDDMMDLVWDKKHEQAIEIAQKYNGVQFPGPNGTLILQNIETEGVNARENLDRVEYKEMLLDDISSGKKKVSDGEHLLILQSLGDLKPLSEDLRTQLQDVRQRIEATDKRRFRIGSIIGALVLIAVIILLANIDFLLAPQYKKRFKDAVRAHQVNEAIWEAKKLQGHYDTAPELKSLNDYVSAKKQFHDNVGKGAEFSKKFRAEWIQIVSLADKANLPCDPEEGVRLYNEAYEKLQIAVQQMDALNRAKESYAQDLQASRLSPGILKKLVPDEWKLVTEMQEQAEKALKPEDAVIAYNQLKPLLQAANEKAANIPAFLRFICNVEGFQVFEGDKEIELPETGILLAPFKEHVLEMRCEGYHSQTLSIEALEPGQPYKQRVNLKKITPPGGDPKADDWKVINDRWVLNIYGSGYAKESTMTDRKKSLMWVVPSHSSMEKNWRDAFTYCSKLTYAGHSDWRLPDRQTLQEQFHHRHLFNNLESGESYWSSTPGQYSSGTRFEWSGEGGLLHMIEVPEWREGAYSVDMANGHANAESKGSWNHAWPVRWAK